MAQATDLMGFGLPAEVARNLATTGPMTISAAGTTYATGTKIKVHQYLVNCSNTTGSNALSLPSMSVAPTALYANQYVINNTGTTSLQVFASSGVTISVIGTNTSQIPVQLNTTLMVWPVTSTLWAGIMV